MDKKLVEDAYRKLKGSVYLDKTVPFLRMRIAEYEEYDIDEKLTALYEAIHDENKWRNYENKIMKSIKVLTFPKKIRNKNEIEDTKSIVISNINGEDIEIEKYNNFIDMSVDGHILGILWILKIGYKIDEKLYENCYGNRLNENLMFDGQKTTASPNLFKPYFNQYESWRNNGLNLAREKAGTKSLIITMLDLTRYYYNVEITEKIYDKMTADFCKDIDDLDIIKRLNRFVYKVFETYSKKCGYKNANILPIGFLPANIIANQYLKDVDLMIDKVSDISYYGRYVDDMLLLMEIPDDEAPKLKKQILEKGNQYIFDYMIKKLSKENILGKNEDESFYLKNYEKLVFQGEKFRFFYIDKDGYDTIIDKIHNDICKNTSEFNYIPETAVEDFGTEILKIERDDSVNKLRSINKTTIDKYAMSKILGKNILMSKFTERKIVEKFTKSLEQILDYKETLNNYTLWESILNYYVINKYSKGIVHLSQVVFQAINHMDENTNKSEEYGYLKSNEIENVGDSLIYYYLSCLTRSTAIFWGEDVDHAIAETSIIFQGCEKYKKYDNLYNIDVIEKIRELYCRSRMINKSLLPINIENFMEEIQPNVSVEDNKNFLPLTQYMEYGLKNPYIKNNRKYAPYILSPFEILFGELLRSIKNGNRTLYSDQECVEILYRKYAENFGKNKGTILERHISVQSFEDEHSVIKIESESKKEMHIAVANVKMNGDDIADILNDKTRDVSNRCKEIGRILNEAIRNHVDLLVFPEAYIPLEYLEILQKKSAKHNMVIIGGIEHIKHEHLVYNLTTTILPIKISETSYAVPFFHQKKYFSPRELKDVEKVGCEPAKGQKHTLFEWNGIKFVTYCCYELTSIKLRQTFQGQADILCGVEWNKDTHYFGNIMEALSRDMYCYCVQANMSEYGDGRIVQPTKKDYANILRVKGGENASVLIGTVDIERLRKCRKGLEISGPFKPLPAGWCEI